MPEMYSFWWWVLFALIWTIPNIPLAILFILTEVRERDGVDWTVAMVACLLGPLSILFFGAVLLQDGTLILRVKNLMQDRKIRRAAIRGQIESKLKAELKKEKKEEGLLITTTKRSIRVSAPKVWWRKFI
jgi:hypothetical protein